jgi:hypothetical protein
LASAASSASALSDISTKGKSVLARTAATTLAKLPASPEAFSMAMALNVMLMPTRSTQ